jgi:hypothetical protein
MNIYLSPWNVGSVILTAVNINNTIPSTVTPCSLVEADRNFEGKYCLHVQVEE